MQKGERLIWVQLQLLKENPLVRIIYIDDSISESNEIQEAFHGRVTVRNCVWHKELNLESTFQQLIVK